MLTEPLGVRMLQAASWIHRVSSLDRLLQLALNGLPAVSKVAGNRQ
jgi:hypothetical protein